MKQRTQNGLTYDVPESKDEQRGTHMGWEFNWEHPPIPYRGLDWRAHDPENPEEGCIFAPTVAELKKLIAETQSER